MILPVKRIPDGHSVLSQNVEISGEQAQWLHAKTLVCRAEIDRIRSQLHVHFFYTGSVEVECARCLTPVDFPVKGDFRIVCVHRSEAGKNNELPEEEIDFVFDDTTDEIDLIPLIYEEIMVSLPMKPLCTEQCPGIVFEEKETAGKKTGERERPVDPRWEALKKLKK
jgi:uncharacterized metal-binding protein YceD (DUF177 family)